MGKLINFMLSLISYLALTILLIIIAGSAIGLIKGPVEQFVVIYLILGSIIVAINIVKLLMGYPISFASRQRENQIVTVILQAFALSGTVVFFYNQLAGLVICFVFGYLSCHVSGGFRWWRRVRYDTNN